MLTTEVIEAILLFKFVVALRVYNKSPVSPGLSSDNTGDSSQPT
jgi:hypothetical protein